MILQDIQIQLELGHRAAVRKKATPEGYTHNWILFVRGAKGSQIEHFVEEVVFQLHESFRNARRGKQK